MSEEMCWQQQECVESMNRFYVKEIKGQDLSNHGHIKIFCDIISQCKKGKLLDLGTGTGMISEYCDGFEFTGADLPHILAGCAMKHYPNYYYRACDIEKDDLQWIGAYDLVIANGLIDVMGDPLTILGKILIHAKDQVLLHRQEITESGQTRSTVMPSYSSNTYHSIINRDDFRKLLDESNWMVVAEHPLVFTNWENNGTSFLLKRRPSWALNNLDHTIYNKLFCGKKEGFYIEAGANDGLTQSNTYLLEKYHQWRGILIEPIAEVYQKCVENRADTNYNFRCALVADSYDYEDARIIYTPGCDGLMSVLENGAAGEQRMQQVGIDNYVKTTTPARTLNSILSEVNPEYIDLLILDIEGHEYNALKGIDFDKWKPDYLLIEELNDNPDIAHLLKQWYDRVEVIGEHDVLYKRKS